MMRSELLAPRKLLLSLLGRIVYEGYIASLCYYYCDISINLKYYFDYLKNSSRLNKSIHCALRIIIACLDSFKKHLSVIWTLLSPPFA